MQLCEALGKDRLNFNQDKVSDFVAFFELLLQRFNLGTYRRHYFLYRPSEFVREPAQLVNFLLLYVAESLQICEFVFGDKFKPVNFGDEGVAFFQDSLLEFVVDVFRL